MILRIRDWNTIFENSESRKLKSLRWVPMPNKTSGQGYTALVEHPDGAQHYAAWCAIVVVCSQRDKEKRGVLPEADGTIGGISRALGRISRLPAKLFESVLPRLIEDPDIMWIEQLAGSPGESPETPGENPDVPGNSPGRIEGKGREGKGTEQKHTESAVSVRERVDRFSEWIAPWPRVANPDHAARCYLSCIDTDADEGRAFAARDRYLASDEVARGVVTDPAKWLMDQKSAKWEGKWPAANARAPNGRASTGDRVLAKMVQRIANGEKPL